MNKTTTVQIIIVALFVGAAMIALWFMTEPRPELNIPTPDGGYTDSQGTCHWWNVERSDNFVGIPGKVWICSDGRVIPDESGVRLPVRKMERDDD